jgi:hypothetical protein
MKEFIKTKLSESLVFEVIDNIIDEEYPLAFDMDKFKSLTKFSQRIAYCEANLKRISSGSSRIVYMIDNEKVLKLAKNQKGLAQNSTEIDWGNDYYFEYILAHTIDSSDKDLWVEMELARKVTKENFKQIMGYTLDDLALFLKWVDFTQVRPDKRLSEMYARMINTVDDENNNYDFDFWSEDNFATKMQEFMVATKSPNGDFCRTSSYGIVHRDGKDQIVLIDFGLTGDIYGTYYS